MTYEEAYNFLESTKVYGSVLGLETMKALMEGLGNPQDHLKFVHIAGTNGKGSTAAFISECMAAAGYRVGRYISPSVFGYEEIIQISQANSSKNNITTEFIKKKDIAKCISKIQEVCALMTVNGSPHPTIFEIETAMAFLYFLQRECDLVVLEVGLGGKLDATNVIQTTLCGVITSISMDHMEYLGDTIEKIAAEKAGIIKAGIKVVSYEQVEAASKVIQEVSEQNRADLKSADFRKIRIEKQDLKGTIFSYEDKEHINIKLLGGNQVKNAVVAILTVDALKYLGYKVTDTHIRQGLKNTSWRGRFEQIDNKPLFIIDGAHNEDAAAALTENIELYLSNKRIIFIVGMLADKDYKGVLKHIGNYADTIYTVTPSNKRGLQSHILAEQAAIYCNKVIDAKEVINGVRLALNEAREEDVILAFGSLSYLRELTEEVRRRH